MSDLVKYYKEYYREQTPASIDSLFAAMLDYDFSSYHEDMRKIFFMYREAKCLSQCSDLRTNGSSSEPTNYKFGPHFGYWIWKIEPFLRNLNLGKTLSLFYRPGNGEPKKTQTSKVEDPRKHYDFFGNLSEREHICELFSLVAELYDAGNKTVFSALPDVWNVLFKNDTFVDLCGQNREKIHCLVNSDFEMLFKNNAFYIRDQMINWRSGLNFFVCEKGNRHFIPSFFASSRSCLNLMNLTKNQDVSDEVFIGIESDLCSCGRVRVPMDVHCHKNNRVLDKSGNPIDFSTLGDSLNGRYKIIQFYQDENDLVTVFLNPHGNVFGSDLETIQSFFGSLKINFVFNRYFEVGAKRYCFWRSDSVKTKDFVL